MRMTDNQVSPFFLFLTGNMQHQLVFTEDDHRTGSLTFRNTWLARKVTSRGSVVSILPHFAAERDEVEDFIRGIYAGAYGAHINVHYPVLMSLRDRGRWRRATWGRTCRGGLP